MRYTKTTLEKLQKVFEEIGYTVRYERGNFQSGYCVVEDRKIAVINKFFDVESRINTLIEILSNIEVDKSVFSDKSLDFYKKISKSLSPAEITTEEPNEIEAVIADGDTEVTTEVDDTSE